MRVESQALLNSVKKQLAPYLQNFVVKDMLTLQVSPENLLTVCRCLRDQAPFHFEELMDICGLDYMEYGYSDWRTKETTRTGFSRGVNLNKPQCVIECDKPRFALAYHLLSVSQNHRIRLKVHLPVDSFPFVSSVIDIWASANWYEREAFDLFGIYFDGHPNLRRLLTDYGFKGHPFRKDFPLIGEVEMRYDAAQGCCVYEPVSIVPRTSVPKVIRDDNRYLDKTTPKKIDKEHE